MCERACSKSRSLERISNQESFRSSVWLEHIMRGAEWQEIRFEVWIVCESFRQTFELCGKVNVVYESRKERKANPTEGMVTSEEDLAHCWRCLLTQGIGPRKALLAWVRWCITKWSAMSLE